MQNNTPQIQKLEDKQVACVSFTGNYMANPQIFKKLLINPGNVTGMTELSTELLLISKLSQNG